MNKKASWLAVAAAMLSLQANAKIIQGKVENASGRAVANAEVKVRGSDITTKTDEQGRFEIDLPVGTYTLDVKGGTRAHFHQIIDVTESAQDSVILTMKEETEHRLVVRANPLEHTTLNMATPAIIISGEELILKRSDTLGDILQYEPGLNVSSFGPAVSRPIIRGLGEGRVKITNNQMIVQDASTTSADHDVGIEPLLAERVEVLKGPATLLYGSGAIGGVVNATDRKISDDSIEELTGGIEARIGDSGTGEQSLIFTLDGGNEQWNWHVDGYSKETDNVEIPVEAESEALRLSEGEEGGAGQAGEFENSQSDTQGGSVGATYLGDWGHIGFAMSSVDKTYGVPGHGHHEEEEEEEHEGEEHGEEGVAIDMQQTRYDLQAEFDSPISGIDTWYIGYALTDYEHVELEGDEIGTMFDNEAWELKSYMKHTSVNGWEGVFGIQFTDRDFSAIGEEAFVPPSNTQSTALFAVEEREVGNLKLELGLRVESNKIKVEGQEEVDETGFSFSFGNVYTISEHNKIAINFSRATRFASVEELFSDGPHAATSSFEIGNADLESEASNNLDFSYRFESDNITGEINVFWNQFEDYIYGALATDTDPCVSAEAAMEAADEELFLVCNKQQDAEFKGVELDISIPLTGEGSHQFTLGFIADYLSAEFDDGTNVPRIPPMKTGAMLHYDFNNFSADLSYINYAKQDDIADNELATDGFDMVNFDMAYRVPFNGDELFLFFKGQNLLDEEARDHSSFLKDLAPRVGRHFVVGARYTF